MKRPSPTLLLLSFAIFIVLGSIIYFSSSSSSDSSTKIEEDDDATGVNSNKNTLPSSFAELVISLTQNSLPSSSSTSPPLRGHHNHNNYHWRNSFDFTMFHRAAIVQASIKIKKQRGQSSLSSTKNNVTSNFEVLPCTDEFLASDLAQTWSIKTVRQVPVRLPKCFANLKQSLRTLKIYMSIAFGRLAFDKELEKDYQSLLRLGSSSSSIQLQKFIQATSKVISSYFVMTQSMLQTFIDAGLVVVANKKKNHQNTLINNKKRLVQLFKETKVRFFGESSSNPILLLVRKKISMMMRKSKFSSRWLERNLQSSLLPLLGEEEKPTEDINNDTNDEKDFDLGEQQRQQQETSSLDDETLRRTIDDYDEEETPNDNNKMINQKAIAQQRRLRLLHPFVNQRPIEGRYWNMFRPFLSCSTAPRTCELPEGCRFVCNPEFLVSPLLSTAEKRQGKGNDEHRRRPRHAHEIVGIGSNNEFDWEESLIHLYSSVSSSKSSPVFSIFDCTVPEFRPSPRIEKYMTSSSSLMKQKNQEQHRFRFSSYCVSDRYKVVKQIAVKDLVRAGTFGRSEDDQNLTKSSIFYFPISGLVDLLAHVDEKNSNNINRGDEDESKKKQNNKDLEFFSTSSSINSNKSKKSSSINSNKSKKKQKSNYRSIDIFKLDAESFEFVAIPEWTSKSFETIGSHMISALMTMKSSSLPTSSSSSPTLLSSSLLLHSDRETLGYEIQQFQYELHRRGWTALHAATGSGFLHTFILQLQLLSHGFSTFASEKNHFGNCCQELAMVHHRFFIRSETFQGEEEEERK